MNKNLRRDFTKYVSLNILGQMAYSFYTVADTFFVSADLGADGLTALNLAFPIFCLISGLGVMLGVGGGARYAVLKSRGDDAAANRTFTAAVYIAVILSSIFVFAGALLSRHIVRLLGADSSVFAITHTYLQVMMLFAPAFLMNHLLQGFIRNDGMPSLSTAAMMIGSLSNVVLDYVFIFPMGMGILGAIFATGLAPVISLGVLSPYLFQKKNHFHFAFSKEKREDVQGILSGGVPPLVTEVTSGVVMFLFNFIILRLTGNIGVAAFSVVSVMSLVVVALYTGLSQGLQPLLSQSYGEGRFSDNKVFLRYGLVIMLAFSVIIYSSIAVFAPQLTQVFNSEGDAALQALAVEGLRLYFLACPFLGFNVTIATYFVATQHPRPGQIISLSRGFLVLVPVAFLLSVCFKMTGVWCAYPVTEIIVALLSLKFYLKQRRI